MDLLISHIWFLSFFFFLTEKLSFPTKGKNRLRNEEGSWARVTWGEKSTKKVKKILYNGTYRSTWCWTRHSGGRISRAPPGYFSEILALCGGQRSLLLSFSGRNLSFSFHMTFLISVCLLKIKRGGWSQQPTTPSHGIRWQNCFTAWCLDSSKLERSERSQSACVTGICML